MQSNRAYYIPLHISLQLYIYIYYDSKSHDKKGGGSYLWDAETSFHAISVLTFKDIASPCSVMFTHKPAKVYSLLKESVEIVALS